MSIPRLAIQRPVTMFMLSAVITLLGFISLTRLPVDLMPEFQQPTLNIRTSYAGVGPLEMEELITRPIEQAVGAVPGLIRIESSSSEGNSQVQLNFEWGSDLAESADEVRTRMDRIRARLPEDADPPTIQKFDPSQLPVAQIGIEGDYDPVTLREIAQNEIAPRFERIDGVAAVNVNGGPAPSDSRRSVEGKDHRAQSLGEPGRHARCGRRTRTRRSARSIRATPPTWCAARGSSAASRTSAIWWS